jgi:very-short-patch-repair endonuclease
VVVETDGWLAHSTPYAFEADRATTNALQLQGWLVLRFTWADLTRRARQVAATVCRALTR